MTLSQFSPEAVDCIEISTCFPSQFEAFGISCHVDVLLFIVVFVSRLGLIALCAV